MVEENVSLCILLKSEIQKYTIIYFFLHWMFSEQKTFMKTEHMCGAGNSVISGLDEKQIWKKCESESINPVNLLQPKTAP